MSRIALTALIALAIAVAAPAAASARLSMPEGRFWAKRLLSGEKKELRQRDWIIIGAGLSYCERWTAGRVFCRGWVEAAHDDEGDWRCGYDLHVIEKRNGGLVTGIERDNKCRRFGG